MIRLSRPITLLILGVIVCSLFCAGLFLDSVNIWRLGLYMVLILLSAGPMLFNIRRNVDLFHPSVGFPVVYGFLYGLGALYLYVLENDYAFKVLLYSCIGIAAYQAGTKFVGNRQQNHMNFPVYSDWDKTRIFDVLKVVLPISLVSAVYIYSKLGVPILSADIFELRNIAGEVTSHYPFFLLRNVGLIFHMYFIYHFSRKPQSYRSSNKPILYFFVLAFCLLLSTAGRADILFLLAPLVIEYHYMVRKIKPLRTALVVTSTVFLLMLYNFFRLVRYPAEHETLTYLGDKYHGDLLSMISFHFFAQMSLVGTNFTTLLENIPSRLDYFYGRLIPQTLSVFLPGHQDPPGAILKKEIGLEFTGGWVNLTLIGDFYYDFGVVGIFFGMFFLGIITKLAYCHFKKRQNSSSAFLYIILMYSIIVAIPGGLFSQAIRYYYLLLVVIINLYAKKKNDASDMLGNQKVF